MKKTKTPESQRLSDARKALGLTLQACADPLDMTHATFMRWEQGESPIGKLQAAAIEKYLGISSDWLLYGTEPMMVQNVQIEHSDNDAIAPSVKFSQVPDDFIFLPHISNRLPAEEKTSFPPANFSLGKMRRVMGFSQSWLKEEFGDASTLLYLFDVLDDSMEPTLSSKDTVMVKCNSDERSGICLLHVGEDLVLVRAKESKPGNYMLSCDNPKAPPFEFGDKPISWFGRVVWILKNV
jgi:phage repressor protein C with HTH and peptisase S24 domain